MPHSFAFFAKDGNDNGNVYQIANGRDGNRTQNFSYDNLNRIAQAFTTGPNWGETYTIDNWGNLTNRAGVTGMGTCLTEPLNTTASTQNRLSGLTYDAAGNVTNDGNGNTPTYDGENRIITDAGVNYSYDVSMEIAS